MSTNVQIKEIGAEMLLNLLYPELEDRWTARHAGTFYRNYNRDVLSVNPEENSVELSRDSILRLLPEGLITREEDFRKGDIKEKHDELEEQRKLLSEAFLPIDSVAFRRNLKMERSVSELLNGKLEYLLKNYFGFDLASEQNPYVREVAVLLPYVRNRRGDFGLIRNLLEGLFHCKVNTLEGRYSELDNNICWLPSLRYELLISGLTPEQYRSLSQDIKPLESFLAEWFVPLELHLEILVKQHQDTKSLNSRLTLDYNTEL